MHTSKVTSKGQIVIPSKLRKKYKIKKGTQINFLESDGEIKLIPTSSELIKKNFGVFKTKGKLMNILKEEKKKEKLL